MIHMPRILQTSLPLLLLFFLVLPVSAREIKGVEIPETMEVGGRTLVLNGAGMRSKFLLDVYIGALYLEQPSHDGTAVAAADAPMLMRMYFVFDGVPADRLRKGWMKGLLRIVPDPDEQLRSAMTAFANVFTVKVQRGDIYDVAWLPGRGLEVRFNGKLIRTIDNLDLKKALFTIWVGDKAGDADLRKALLGL
jgi:hypothetical protein